jgi:hypothetical protein
MYKLNKMIPIAILTIASVALAQPSLITPPNSCVIYDNTPLFDWSDESGAIAYRIQIDDAVDFSSPIINTTTTVSEYQVVDPLTGGGESCYVYWRARVDDPLGDWSETYALIVINKPTNLIYPLVDMYINNPTPTFQWELLTGAIFYRFLVTPSGSVTPVIDDSMITNATYTPLTNLSIGEYNWVVIAKDELGNWGLNSESWPFLIGTAPQLITNLISPPEGYRMTHRRPTFIWNSISTNATYNLFVKHFSGQSYSFTTSETTYTPTTDLPGGTHTWKVRGKDENSNWWWYEFSPSRTFTLWSWAQKESMPSPGAPKKYVKDGASMVGAVLPSKDGENALYAFRGCKSKELWQYVTAWVQKESLLYGVKPDKPTKINKKAVGKGASLCYDGANIIYATKGNGTTEFWAYYILEDSWAAKAFVPVPKALKGGTSIAYLDGKVYLLAGGQKKTDLNNFYGYDVATDAWTPLASLTLGPNIKIWKDGACLTKLGGTLYALKSNDKYNPFFSYEVLTNTWTEFDSIPMLDSLAGKKKKVAVKDGGAMCASDDAIYAIKGGGTPLFWKYTTLGGWTRSDTIPRLHKKSIPKTGAALAYANEKVYLLKGNNTPEFWEYTPTVTELTRINPTTNISLMANTIPIAKHNNNLTVNTLSNTVRYTVPVASKVTIKLYNAIGRLVDTMHNGYLNAGTYTMNISRIASGVYFLQYEHNTVREEIKLIVQ